MNLSSSSPRLSLVAPTMGKKDGILRMLESLVTQAPRKLMGVTELVVFLNAAPDAVIDISALENYLTEKCGVFHSARLIRADKYHLTAEESACAACAYATGEYLWLAGDKRIFLAGGLAQLARYIENPVTTCAYFNAVWRGRDDPDEGQAATHMSASVATLPYKQFVQASGINFMATNMGAWIYQRKFLDLAVWRDIIARCGPHFSHVATLLATMGQADVTCHAVFLCILEAKAYHSGDGGEWEHYAQIAGTYRFYAWTFGLVRQYKYLIARGTYSYADMRRAICCESAVLRRQADEIYRALAAQIWRGYLFGKELIRPEEFEEILSFLAASCPERAIIHHMLGESYALSRKNKPAALYKRIRLIQAAVNLDSETLPLSSLIIGQTGDDSARLHPRGYLLSKADDKKHFLPAYQLIDAPRRNEHWRIVDESELASLNIVPRDFNAPLPAKSRIGMPLKARLRQSVMDLAASFIMRMPKRVIIYAWQRRS